MDESNHLNEQLKKTFEVKEDFIIYNNTKATIGKSYSDGCCGGCGKVFCPCLKKINTTEKRAAFIHENQYNHTVYTNKLSNHKYNSLTFIPIVLFNQFKFFGNQFYLLMTITQFVDELKVGFLFSYLSPLLIVIFISMFKELYDDIKRYRQDKRTNNEDYIKIVKDPLSEDLIRKLKVKAMDIQIGDIIELNQNQRIPADIIILKAFADSNDSSNTNVFIRTDQLDGETDWKLRKAPQMTQVLNTYEIFDLFNAYILSDPPSKQIYEYTGVLNSFDSDHNIIKEALGLENTLWASTIFASKKGIGIVIYTGNETRAQMNSSQPKQKVGILDNEVNKLNKILFIIMVILALTISCIKGFDSNFVTWLIVFFRFIVLFCGIIPISLRVNLDISKAFFALSINKDKKKIPDTIVRNSTIPEELGRITYVFTDKTGTLTKNEMIFKQIAMETDQFSDQSFSELNSILIDECTLADAPLIDMLKKMENESFNSDSISSKVSDIELKKPKRYRRSRTKIIRETIQAMALCNNVTPIIDENSNTVTYQASSPDEVALVKFADKLNMKLSYRTDKIIRIKNAVGTVEEYQILANFPFSSDTKRMGILLKNKAHGHLIFYLKGAESIIEKFVKEEYKGYIKENAENLACVGLRTLVLTQKLITQSFYDGWVKRYQEALTSMENRKENTQKVIEELEINMDFLCVTGVEDLLQDNVAHTIENLRNAGMKIWMLTGDKIETATCISISAGIKGKMQKLFYIRADQLSQYDEGQRINELSKLLDRYKHFEDNINVLIIDGDSLELCLNNIEREFFLSAMKAPSVVCCRCSPTQKSKIVQRIKKYTNKITAAIGDGGNDVAMIQQADVGIGIVGKEGLQASLASDFSIIKFDYLNNLLLFWGRMAYKNTATMCNFVVHRGMIISLIQFIFSLMFYCNAVALYNGMLILGYSTLYTTFPAISVLLDRDTARENVVKFPGLYRKLLQGRELSTKEFLWWFGKSIFQASVIMIGSIYLFEEKIYLKLVTVTFTELIFVELLNVYTEIHSFHPFMIGSLIGTFVCYILTLLLFPSILDAYFIFDWMTFGKIILISIVSWIFFFIYKLVKKLWFPETHEKLNVISLEPIDLVSNN